MESLLGALRGEGDELSFIDLFLMADIVVKSVIIGLVIASIWSWAIIFSKWALFSRTRRQLKRFEQVFWSGQSLDSLYKSLSQHKVLGLAAIFVAAMKEWKRSHQQGAASHLGLQARIDKVLNVAIGREAERLDRQLTFLASIGSAAPFIGLFGTVWGIMNAFQEIAREQSTNLAVVAPGIAEALFATALGLLAAIPAVMGYNKLASDSSKIVADMEAFADEFAAILSRQLDGLGAK